MTLSVFLHGFGARYDLPISLSLYLFAGAAVVVVSFVLAATFAFERVGDGAVRYARWPLPAMDGLVGSRVPRIVGGALSVLRQRQRLSSIRRRIVSRSLPSMLVIASPGVGAQGNRPYRPPPRAAVPRCHRGGTSPRRRDTGHGA
jgi:hypothetical protein